MIIGISGKFASGKDTVADYLVKVYLFRKLAFAAKLKEICSDLFGMKDKDRELLQKVGVAMREIRNNVWVDYLVTSVAPEANIVVTDLRFPNEFEALKAKGAFLIRLEVPQQVRVARYRELYKKEPTEEQLTHESETALDDERQWDYVLNNGGRVDELNRQVDRIMRTLFGYAQWGQGA